MLLGSKLVTIWLSFTLTLWPQEAEAAVAKRLKEAALENQELRAESARLQHQNNRLQGYALDDAGAEQLSELIGSLTQVGCQCSSIEMLLC